MLAVVSSGGIGDTEKCGYIYALTVFLFLEK
jgi:hypothetical protein